jgi:hypothetical protein
MTNKTYERIIAEMPAGLDRAILRVLDYHHGKVNAVGREALVLAVESLGFDTNERQVRRAIHDLRRQGYLILSAPGEDGGYYLAADLDEFRLFIDRELHPKAIDMLETEAAMQKAARQQFGEGTQPALLGG